MSVDSPAGHQRVLDFLEGQASPITKRTRPVEVCGFALKPMDGVRQGDSSTAFQSVGRDELSDPSISI
jgi:hypothetical protein